MASKEEYKVIVAKRPDDCFGCANKLDKVCFTSDSDKCPSFEDCLILTVLQNKGYDPNKPISADNDTTFKYKVLSEADRIKLEKILDKEKERAAAASAPTQRSRPATKEDKALRQRPAASDSSADMDDLNKDFEDMASVGQEAVKISGGPSDDGMDLDSMLMEQGPASATAVDGKAEKALDEALDKRVEEKAPKKEKASKKVETPVESTSADESWMKAQEQSSEAVVQKDQELQKVYDLVDCIINRLVSALLSGFVVSRKKEFRSLFDSSSENKSASKPGPKPGAKKPGPKPGAKKPGPKPGAKKPGPKPKTARSRK